MFPHTDRYSWGISSEYLPGLPEPAEGEIIRLRLCDTIFIKFESCIYHKQNYVSFLEATTRGVV